jgi:hypothetical protein
VAVCVGRAVLQIYMERITDLLRVSETEEVESKLSIREDPKRGLFVEHLTQVNENACRAGRRGEGGAARDAPAREWA